MSLTQRNSGSIIHESASCQHPYPWDDQLTNCELRPGPEPMVLNALPATPPSQTKSDTPSASKTC